VAFPSCFVKVDGQEKGLLVRIRGGFHYHLSYLGKSNLRFVGSHHLHECQPESEKVHQSFLEAMVLVDRGRVKSTMPKKIHLGTEVLDILSKGIEESSRAVRVAYGPHGSRVAISKLGKILLSPDGLSILKECQFGDLRRIGTSLVRSASVSTENSTGDGTSTTVLLVHGILENFRACADEKLAISVANEIQSSMAKVETKITEISKPAKRDTLRMVGLLTSKRDEELTDQLLGALDYVGEGGTVLLGKGEGIGLEVDSREGLVLSEGWCSGVFAGEGERVLEGPLVAVIRDPLKNMRDVTSLMEESSQWPGRELVVFCPSLTGEALAMMALNHEKGVLPSLVIEFKGIPKDLEDWLEDIAAATNSTVVSSLYGMSLRNFQSEWLGVARKVTATKAKTYILSYQDDEVSARISLRATQLLALAEDSPYDYDKDEYRRRAAALDGGVVLVRVGGVTELEAQVRRALAEDTLQALNATLRSGVVPGAGAAFVAGAKVLSQGVVGERILRKALMEPLVALAVHHEPQVIVTKALEGTKDWVGWDPVQNTWRDFSEGPQLLDPTEVILTCLRTAVSVACQILKAQVLVSDLTG
jgi:chaperonin GroEL